MQMNLPARIAAVAAVAMLLLPQHAAAQGSGTNNVQALTAAYNASGFALFKGLSARPGNIVFSPFSIGSAMAMVLSGARGETEREMASVLRQRLSRTAMEAAQTDLLALLKRYDQEAPRCPPGMAANGARCEAAPSADGRCPVASSRQGALCVASASTPPSARLLTANALMLPGQGDLISADYATLLRDRYQAEVFRNAGLDQINGWVSQKTEGKIEKILDMLDPSAAAVILNAVYFKASWAHVFSKAATKNDTFNLSSRQNVSVPTMQQANAYALAVRSGYRAIRLPYSIGQIGMVIMLPDDIDGLDAVSRRIDDNEWTAVLADLHAPTAVKTVDLKLPRFKTSLPADLVAPFRAAGMIRAFDRNLADFSGMSAGVPLAIGAIVHRAAIDVMEDGTEAAAATAVVMVPRAAPGPSRPVEILPFHVDRPFLFAIVDDASGAVMFQGRIDDPR
jgi:serpin B